MQGMYDAFSSDYDRFVNWQSRIGYEMPFLTRFLDGAGASGPARVLDAACGTGMHAIELARRGYRCAGADLSPGMVARAEQNARQAGVDVAWAAAGFGDLKAAFQADALFPFDAVLCLGNSLPHLLDSQALAAALEDFGACLRPGGRLLLQNRNFDAVMRDRQRWMEPQSFQEREDEWLFLRFYDYLPGGLIDFNIVTLRRSGGGAWGQQVHTTPLRPLLEAELREAMQAAGFEQITAYGSMEGAAFHPQGSGNLIVTAAKA